jgi:hypothetical protein
MWFKGENDAGWSLEQLIPRDWNVHELAGQTFTNRLGIECEYESGNIRTQNAVLFKHADEDGIVIGYEADPGYYFGIKHYYDRSTNAYCTMGATLYPMYLAQFYRFREKTIIRIDARGRILRGKHGDSTSQRALDEMETDAEEGCAGELFGPFGEFAVSLAHLVVVMTKTFTFKVHDPGEITEAPEQLKVFITSEPFDYCRGRIIKEPFDPKNKNLQLDTWFPRPPRGIADPDKVTPVENISNPFVDKRELERLSSPPRAIMVL